MNEWKEQINSRPYLVGILVVLVLLLFAWICFDSKRNEPIYHDTDTTVAYLEKRIQSAEQRIDGMSKRIEQNQKTIESVERGISTSTGLAIEIEEGTGRAEDRLDSAIARTERIKGIIADIEKANR